MSRILLVHWNENEAAERARKLEKYGHKVRTLFRSDRAHLDEVRNFPPDLFVIDLSRLPSQGRELAGYFRRLKSTRQVPILFMDGEADRVQRVRNLIPDAEFAKSGDIKNASSVRFASYRARLAFQVRWRAIQERHCRRS